jgi:hypothetical protein
MFRFTAATEGQNRIGIREKLQAFANDYGVPAHCDEEQAAALVLSAFIRTVKGELELLELECIKTVP